MYDEATRQQDHYWASLTYAQEEGRAAGHADGMAAGLAEGRAEGMRLGIEQGIEQGIERGIGLGIEQGRLNTINMIADLVKGGFLTKELGAQKLNLSEQEFETYL